MATVEEVKQYYDEWTVKYLDVYGDIIQAFRPTSDGELATYTAQNAGLRKGQHILDAGSGVSGPAIAMAEKSGVKFSCITVSPQQAGIAKQRVSARRLDKIIDVTEGDYHNLPQYFKQSTFDGALFLESLGHASNVAQVAQGVYQVLKPGAYVYIKDFFYKISLDEAAQARINEVIKNMNVNYSYSTLGLSQTLDAFRQCGFEIDYIKHISFNSDIEIRRKFEDKFGIDNYKGLKEFAPAEWLELRLIKPAESSGLLKWLGL